MAGWHVFIYSHLWLPGQISERSDATRCTYLLHTTTADKSEIKNTPKIVYIYIYILQQHVVYRQIDRERDREMNRWVSSRVEMHRPTQEIQKEKNGVKKLLTERIVTRRKRRNSHTSGTGGHLVPFLAKEERNGKSARQSPKVDDRSLQRHFFEPRRANIYIYFLELYIYTYLNIYIVGRNE